MSAHVPSPDSLQDLARFLFTAPNLIDEPDEDQPHKSFQVGGATVEDLTATRNSANPDNIQALIEATLKLLANPNAVNRNPVVAYALAYQLLPRARDLTPDRVAEFEKAMVDLEAANPGVAAQVQSALGAAAESRPRQRRSRGAQFLVDRPDSRRTRRRAVRPCPPTADPNRRPAGSRSDLRR